MTINEYNVLPSNLIRTNSNFTDVLAQLKSGKPCYPAEKITLLK